MRHSKVLKLVFLSMLLLGLPLAGVILSGQSIGPYIQFPRTTRYVPHEPFSPVMFLSLGVCLTISLLPFLTQIAISRKIWSNTSRITLNSFPIWGWFGLALGGIFWILAWTRFEWFSYFQRHTFVPLWIAYILVINAFICLRNGSSTLTEQPGRFLLLFAVSAIFWWCFEYFNRFVQNWYYQEVDDFTVFEYAILASISFSTVLPAVLSTKELLMTFSIPTRAFQNAFFVKFNYPKRIALAAFLAACAGLALVGVYPNYCFPILWTSPLVVIVSVQALTGEPHIFSSVPKGDWSNICQWAMAALICGFFWEMWNYHSMAKWVYSIPYVHRYQLFEMPLLGYFGYLPFGLECAIITNAFLGTHQRGR